MTRPLDVIVVGAGPAGAAAALQVAILDSELASRTLVLDGERFPREKLCGGGLTAESDRFLRDLRVSDGFTSIPIRTIIYEYPHGRAVKRANHFFRVVHRREFDAALVRAARARGIEVRDGDPVRLLEREANVIRVVTESGASYRTRVLIGADGAHSKVRRALVCAAHGERFVALETLTRGHDHSHDVDSETAVFDFRPASDGVRVYAWDFPSLRDGEPWMNRGLCASTRWRSTAIKDAFAAALAERGVACGRREMLGGAGPPFYDPQRPQSAERVLLAGDAVGIDPWFGEGISVALGTGILAARAAVEGLATEKFAFDDHAGHIARSAVGWSLGGKQLMAERFYRSVSREPTTSSQGVQSVR